MKFHIGTVLSITHDSLVSPRHMDGVYEICDGLTGVSHMTHQLPRVAEQLKPFILEQHPQLAEITIPDWSYIPPNDRRTAIMEWLDEVIVPKYGEELDIEPLPSYQAHDALTELAEMVGDKPVIPIILEGKVGM